MNISKNKINSEIIFIFHQHPNTQVCICPGMNVRFAFFWLVPWHCSWTSQPPTNATTMFYGSHSIIHIFKNYFVIVIVFSAISFQFSINMQHPNTPLAFKV